MTDRSLPRRFFPHSRNRRFAALALLSASLGLLMGEGRQEQVIEKQVPAGLMEGVLEIADDQTVSDGKGKEAVATHGKGETLWDKSKSLRVHAVKPGGPLDDSGIRKRDEVIGVQIGGKTVMFSDFHEGMRILGEGIDVTAANGGKINLKLRAGRDGSGVPVAIPKAGSFIPGHAIEKGTVEGKENKNERMFRGTSRWLAKHQGEDGLISPNGDSSPATALAGLSWMSSPNPDDQARAAKCVAHYEGVLGKDLKIWFNLQGEDCNEKINDAVAGPNLYGWAILLVSEYNWRHPDPKRTALLQKACDAYVQYHFNPSYKYKAPSKLKDDKYFKDPDGRPKEYRKEQLDFTKLNTRDPSNDVFDGLVPDPSPAMAMWCWSHCAATCGVKVPPQAFQAGIQWGTDKLQAKGKGALSRHDAACMAQALLKATGPAAALGSRMADFVAKSPLHGDESEAGMAAVAPMLMRGGVAAYRQRFPEWRWYLSLMMQPSGEAKQAACKRRAYLYNTLYFVFETDENANALAAFLLAVPARKLMMTGAAAPAAVSEGYDIKKGPESSK